MTPGGPKRRGPEGRKLGLHGWLALRDALLAAFGGVLAYAREQAGVAERAPETAVHEYRKSIRRARAVVRLLRPVLEPEDAAALEAELRAALGAASGLRDAHVLGLTLARLTPPGNHARAPKMHARARAARARAEFAAAVRSAQAALAPRPDEAQDRPAAAVLAEGAARLEPLPQQFAEALARRVDAGDVARGLARLFRRAASTLHAARDEPTDEKIHDWRKRVKELRYALELLDRPAAPRAGPLRRTAGRLAEGLGEVTDLILLRRALLELDGTGARDVRLLTDALEAQIQAGFAEMVRVAEPLGERKPRASADEILSGIDGPPGPPTPAPPPLVRPPAAARRRVAAVRGGPSSTTRA